MTADSLLSTVRNTVAPGVGTVRFACIMAVVLGLGGCATPSPPLVPGSPESVGMDSEKLREAVDLYRDLVAEDELRGVVLLVARRGVVVLHEALGWRDKENGLPMEKNTLFRMASNTKPTVTAAALILAQEGHLFLDDPVGLHIPAFSEGDFAGITVGQLMSNSSGLPRSPIFLRGVDENSDMVREAERFAEALEMENEPGTVYGYSNAGFNILGGVIEAVTGQNLEVVLTERIYEPLGMVDSNNHESTADHTRMAKVYTGRGEETRARWSPGDPPSYPIVRASGGMISTAWDYAVFMQMWLNGGRFGEARILSEESVAEGITVQSPTGSYGYGWSVASDGGFSHGGSDGTFAWADPERELIGLVFTQHPSGENPRGEFRRMVNAAIFD